MDEDKKKQVQIILGIACLVIAVAVFFVFSNPFSGGFSRIGSSDAVYICCTNEECNAELELTKEEFAELTIDIAPRARSMAALKCPECSEETAYKAVKCSKCGKIYLLDYEAELADKCPSCGFSATEERRKKYKK